MNIQIKASICTERTKHSFILVFHARISLMFVQVAFRPKSRITLGTVGCSGKV